MEGGVALCRLATTVQLLGDPAAEKRCILRLGDHDPGGGTLLAKHTRYAFQCSTRPEATHPMRETILAEVANDLGCSGLAMDVGAGLILELATEEPAIILGQLTGDREHS